MKRAAAGLLAVALANAPAMAAGRPGAEPARPATSWIEAAWGFGYFGVDDIRVRSDSAYRLAANVALGGNLLLLGQFDTRDFGAIATDLDSLSAGLGYAMPLGPGADLVLGVTYEELELSAAGFESDGFGYLAEIRARVGGGSELSVGYKRSDVEGGPAGGPTFGDEFDHFSVGGALPLSPLLDLTLRLDWQSSTSAAFGPGFGDIDVETYAIGLRARFRP